MPLNNSASGGQSGNEALPSTFLCRERTSTVCSSHCSLESSNGTTHRGESKRQTDQAVQGMQYGFKL